MRGEACVLLVHPRELVPERYAYCGQWSEARIYPRHRNAAHKMPMRSSMVSCYGVSDQWNYRAYCGLALTMYPYSCECGVTPREFQRRTTRALHLFRPASSSLLLCGD